MTNANVDQVVQGTSGRNLKLSYKGGSNAVTVPQNVPIVTFAPAERTTICCPASKCLSSRAQRHRAMPRNASWWKRMA